MSEMDFPSGPWTGFYNYGRSVRKHRMDLVLTFADHTVSGDGSDDIARFIVTGRFDETNGECYWTKTYIGGHDVYYRGFARGKEFGDYGNCRVSPAAFTSGRAGRKTATRVTKPRKSQHRWKPLREKREHAFHVIPGLRE